MSQLPAVVLRFYIQIRTEKNYPLGKIRQTVTWVKVPFIFTQSFGDIVKKKPEQKGLICRKTWGGSLPFLHIVS
jgi:hypothetical protein